MPETNTTKNITKSKEITKEMIAAIVSESFREKRERDKMIDAIIAEAYRKKRERDKVIDAIIAEAFGKKKPVVDDAEFENKINREDNGQFAEQSGGSSKAKSEELKNENNNTENSNQETTSFKETSDAEKQKKIDSIKIDFSKDNILPKLNKEDLESIDAEDKPVLLKKNVIEINELSHSDINRDEYNKLIGKALYDSDKILQDSKKDNYFHFIGSDEKTNITVLLEVSIGKDYLEIVHCHKMRNKSRKRLERKHETVKK